MSTAFVQGTRPTFFQSLPAPLKYAYQQQRRIDALRSRGALTLPEGQPEPIASTSVQQAPQQPTTPGTGRRTLSDSELKMYGISVPAVAEAGEQLWTRRELAATGWTVKRDEQPIRTERRAAVQHYNNTWNDGTVGLYSVRQCATTEEHDANKLARLVSWQNSHDEWQGLRQKLADIRAGRQQDRKPLTLPRTPEQRRTRAALLYDAGLRKPTVRLYMYLCYLATLDSNVVTVSDQQIISHCYLDNKALKSYKAELMRNKLIECRRVNRKAQYTLL